MEVGWRATPKSSDPRGAAGTILPSPFYIVRLTHIHFKGPSGGARVGCAGLIWTIVQNQFAPSANRSMTPPPTQSHHTIAETTVMTRPTAARRQGDSRKGRGCDARFCLRCKAFVERDPQSLHTPPLLACVQTRTTALAMHSYTHNTHLHPPYTQGYGGNRRVHANGTKANKIRACQAQQPASTTHLSTSKRSGGRD